MKRVIVESPYAGEIKINEIYGALAMHDCLVNYNEAPYASHLLYTRKYVLRDYISTERRLGIDAGFEWRKMADKTVFYVDLLMSRGMVEGLEDCKKKGLPYEIRRLPNSLWERFLDIMEKEDIEVIRAKKKGKE
jgi:hypothetical protein